VTTTPELVEEVIEAHGGRTRWKTFTGLSVDVSAGGLAVASKFQRAGLRDLQALVSTDRQHVSFTPYPGRGHRGVFDTGSVRIENEKGHLIRQRLHPRRSLASPRRLLWWDHLDLLYFGASSLWTYLTTPFSFEGPGFQIRPLEPWTERGETWRRLAVTFPADVDTHSREQVFYFGDDGLLRRQDYTAQEFGSWAKSVNYCHDYREFAGLVIPTRRRVFLRRADNRSRRHPVLIWIDIHNVAISALPPRSAPNE
jgi:hypothetical protein